MLTFLLYLINRSTPWCSLVDLKMYLYVQVGGLTKILLFQSSVLFYKVGEAMLPWNILVPIKQTALCSPNNTATLTSITWFFITVLLRNKIIHITKFLSDNWEGNPYKVHCNSKCNLIKKNATDCTQLHILHNTNCSVDQFISILF